ncbi:MAG: hypothetical protein WD078_04425 [Woeseia sp.]
MAIINGLAAALTVAAGTMNVPIDSLQGWSEMAFRNIPQNEVTATADGLHIRVRGSASPLVYRFDEPVAIRRITVTARWNGEVTLPGDAVQGSEQADDFVLKVGLVEEGDKRLNWFQRRIAADWILRLHDLAPPGTGIAGINFYSTTQQREQLGTSRAHPLSDLMHEERVTWLREPGTFRITKTFEAPMRTLGLWLAADGDNTGSSFDLQIESIEIAAS